MKKKNVKPPLNVEKEVIDLFHEIEESPSYENEAIYQKVKRDTFTMPVDDYKLIKQIRHDALSSGITINKSEVVRAGLQLLSHLSNIDLELALNGIHKVRTGRPKVV
ncbi:MAG: hypothetical protein GY730_05715 [bacterium]|nr:hypothetical protein [bacterium]